MTLRSKALLSVGLTFGVLGFACYLLIRTALLPHFDSYESDTTRANVQRVLSAIQLELGETERRAFDWARWDDTYRFIADGNGAYIESNLDASVFPATDLDILAFVDLAGRVVWGARLDALSKSLLPLSTDLRQRLLVPALLQGPDATQVRAGILLLPEAPALVTAAPILRSRGVGPSRGTLLMVRLYTPLRVRKLGELTRLAVAVNRLDDPSLAPEVRGLAAAVARSSVPTIRPVSDREIRGYAVIPDVGRNPGLLVTVTEPRDLHQHGNALGRFLAGSLLVMVLVSALVLSGVLSRILVSPSVRLGRQLSRIGAAGDFKARVGGSGKDEVAHLAQDVDRMLAALENSQAELQHAFEELRLTQEAMVRDERFRALGQLAGGIGHDINNGLLPIMALADLLSRDESLSEDARVKLRTIRAASQGIAATVARLRHFYRSGPEDRANLPIDLNQIVEEVAELTRPRWESAPMEKGKVVTLASHLEPDLPPVRGNAAEIREALANLVINAVDAMPEGGQLRFRTRALDARRVAVEITDTGVGMEPEVLRRCLEPFFTTKGERGTGLGLAMVYGTIRRHGAEIELDSQPGQGTTVRILFPVVDEAVASQAEPRIPSGTHPLKLLCIEDESMGREALRSILAVDGHQVVVVDGGQAGVDAFLNAKRRGQPFDAVLTDLGMPGMDGRDVARRIKAEAPDVFVILVTGWGPFLAEGGGPVDNVDLILSKPIALDPLRATLARVADSISRGTVRA